MEHLTDRNEPEPVAASVETTRRLLGGIGRTKLFELIDNGQLHSVKIGSRRLISMASIRALVDGPQQATGEVMSDGPSAA